MTILVAALGFMALFVYGYITHPKDRPMIVSSLSSFVLRITASVLLFAFWAGGSEFIDSLFHMGLLSILFFIVFTIACIVALLFVWGI